MTETKKTNKKLWLGIGIVVVLVAAMALIYGKFGAKPVAGSKSITIEVVNKTQEVTSYDLQTDAEFLRQAIEEVDGLTVTGTESEYGLMVDTVNGERADYTLDGAYWSFTVNGEYSNYGIDTQPVMNGDVYGIIYTPAQ